MADPRSTNPDAPHNAATPPGEGPAHHGNPPGYDPSKEAYAGISSGALRDIEDVQAARDFAEMIVDTVREALLILDLDLRVKAANETFYQTFGVGPEETVGRLVYDLGNGQWDIPSLREFLEGILPYERAFDDFEVDHVFEGIGRREMLLNGRRMDDHDMILLAIEDVTERRREAGERARSQTAQEQSERLLQALLEQMPSGVSVAEAPSGRLLFHNEEAVRLLRHPLLESADYQGYAQYGASHADGTPYAPEEYPIARALSGEVVHHEEMWYRRGDGTHTTFLVNAAPVRDNAGDIVRAVSTFHDVSDLKRAQEALRELNETLEARVEERTRQVRELSRALTLAEQQERQRIAYILHDDLQQVLFAAKLAGAAGDAEQFERVIDQAIDLTRSLSHELSPPLLKDEDLSGLLEWVADKKMERYGLEVEVDVGHGTSLPDADLRILFYQLVRELLFNVAKHAQTDRARVVAERAGVFVRVRIEDEGVGFDPAVLEEARSVGLGLASVRERLELVGGRLDVESAPGRGTRITMEVPLHAAKDAGTAASRS